MKISEALREAARLIDERKEHFSCNAAARIGGVDAMHFYTALLSPRGDNSLRVNDFAGPGCKNHHTQKTRDDRTLALLMAAEVAESEGL